MMIDANETPRFERIIRRMRSADAGHQRIFLFISLFALFFLTPAIDSVLAFEIESLQKVAQGVALVATLAFTIFVLISAVIVVSSSRRDVVVALLLGSPFALGALFMGLQWALQNDPMLAGLISGALFAPFGFFVAFCLLRFTFDPKHSMEARVFASSSAYIMVGGSFGGLFCLIELLQPGAFIDLAGRDVNFETLRYFSFVTLTTLGYGDIVPRSDEARMVCAAEAICGVFMLAFIVARIFATPRIVQDPSDDDPQA